MKSTPVDSAMARTASCTGLPTVTPQVAFASPMRQRVVEHESRLEPRETGSVQLRAAAEPGEEVRLDETGRDADVRVDPLTVEPHRNVHHLSAVAQRALVASVVVHDSHPLAHLSTEHRLELGGRVAPMGPGGDEHDDVVGVGDALELVEHRWDHEVPGLRSGAVAHRDRDRLARTHTSHEGARPPSAAATRRAARPARRARGVICRGVTTTVRSAGTSISRPCSPYASRTFISGGAYDRRPQITRWG